MKYIIGIPYINRIDLLQEAINSIKDYWDNLVLIDNSGRKELSTQGFEKDFLVIEPIVPLSFTQSQNVFISIAEEKTCDVYMYMHTDALACEGTPGKLLKFIQEQFDAERKWGAIFTNYDTLAALNMEAVRDVGHWDTVFSWYFSDCDYYRRILLKGYEVINSDLNVIHQNNGHNTVKSDKIMKLVFNNTLILYRNYYVSKWGGEPSQERYTVPFNRQDNVMALLTFMQQECGQMATLEQISEYCAAMHLEAQQANRKYSRIIHPWLHSQQAHKDHDLSSLF